MKALALVFIGVISLSGCKYVMGPQVTGSGKSATRQVTVGTGKEIPTFTRIATHGAYDIEVRQGPQSNLAITGDDNLVKLVDLKVKGDELSVNLEGNYSSKLGLKLVVTMPKVEGIEIQGSGNVKVANLDGKEFRASISGSGEMDVAGKSDSFAASISGSGDIDASKLAVANASTSVTGSGSIKVWASKSLKADIAGSGEVLYLGEPNIVKNISGSGDVTKL